MYLKRLDIKHAIANLAKQPVPDVVNEAYHVSSYSTIQQK